MEHQSSVTYGNGFQNGYRGRDLSATGVGMKFDFIVVHESAHEWWGNNISMKDAADMWIHESFANYAENLFVEYHFTEAEAQDYVIGCRKLIRNDTPIIGVYGVNKSGSGDMYYRAATCCTRCGTCSATTRAGAACCAASTRPSGTRRSVPRSSRPT